MRTSVLTCARALGPQGGSTGRVRDTRCTAKNTINSSPPVLFSLFFFCSRLFSAAPCLSFSTRWKAFLPSTCHLSAICYQTRWSRLSFLKILLPPVSFPPWLTFAFVLLKKQQQQLEVKQAGRHLSLSLTVRLLIDSCACVFLQGQISSCPSLFFYHHTFVLHVLTAPTFLSLHHIFSSFPCCTSSPPLFSHSDASHFQFSPSLWHLLSHLFCHDPALKFPLPS